MNSTAKLDNFAASYPNSFCVLPFHNQSEMPIAYRMGDLFFITVGLWRNMGITSMKRWLVAGRCLSAIGWAALLTLLMPHAGRVFIGRAFRTHFRIRRNDL